MKDETLPAGQCLQLSIEPWNGTSRYVSGGHGVQALLPSAAYVPNGHEKQIRAAPKAIVPFPHIEHVSEPSVLAKVPGAHQSQRFRRANVLDADPVKQSWQSASVLFEQKKQPS